MTNAAVINYLNAKAQREQEAKKAELQAMVDALGIDNVLQIMLERLAEVNESIAEVVAEEVSQVEEAKKKISAMKYNCVQKWVNGKNTSTPVEFSDETKAIFDKVIADMGIKIWDKKEGGKRSGKITHKNFAMYVIEASGNDPTILNDIIDILNESGWNRGRGITQNKMEIVYHTLVLHQGKRKQVIEAIKDLLKYYDIDSLKVKANECDAYRDHLNYTEKMMMFVESKVCERINEAPQFNTAA